ncbi:mitochondrial D-lactate ferricytochrome c oxidoreductase [Hyphopichia burtonii NRRL Y-1933]|uniref:D-lactate dehydrogenase (cytochrome) n=1 Tax=Hyphopichia burtonii NRRL Y-1933 TaxID=984485 RepID=A0A1E4RMT0_9ASCO|nr:mitochondrial D-lactate ferricytochrome c oxidoreductase [Hyphopichia burtonii NRRL Y-1933]ODV68588.1 mitochondrial D-lactate ferricytochrome c oxidoreductase [Hyphopichia burtonii NRRL Y-1933]
MLLLSKFSKRIIQQYPTRTYWCLTVRPGTRFLSTNQPSTLRLSPSPVSNSFLKVIVGTSLFTGGILIGQYYSQDKQLSSKDHELLDASTTPIDVVKLPIYANDEEFAVALSKFSEIVGEENVTYETSIIEAHADSFFSTHHPPKPDVQRPHAVIYPANTEQVSRILKVAHEYRVPVVANSGLTSLEGQNMHTRGPNSVSLAFGNLNNILEFHPDDLDVVVQPGVGWQDLDEFLKNREDGKHLMFGPDPGMGASIGGMASTSASGTNAYAYGTMKENVVSLTVVLADGTVVKTRQRPRKSSAGYDTTRLFIGSEGTLGIITEITVKLHVKPKKEFVNIWLFPTIKDAAATALDIISKSGLKLNAIEIIDHTMASFVNQASGDDAKKFLETPTLIFKVGGNDENAIHEQVKIIEKIAKNHNLIRYEESHNDDDNQILWAARRNGLWSTFDFGSKILEDKNDVQIWTTDIAIPISNLATVISETNDDLNNLGFKNRFSVMGHIGDGNCHFLILYNSKDYAKVQTLVDKMVARALKYEGTCTGEHGVGVGKRKYLETELGTTTVDLMRHLKLSLDPRLILNPDKVFKTDPNEKLEKLLDAGHLHEGGKGCC